MAKLRGILDSKGRLATYQNRIAREQAIAAREDHVLITDSSGSRKCSRALFQEKSALPHGEWPASWVDVYGIHRLPRERDGNATPAATPVPVDEWTRARNAAMDSQRQRQGPTIAAGVDKSPFFD